MWSNVSFVSFLILALAPMCSNASSSCADLSDTQRVVAEIAKNYIFRTYPDFKADDLCLQVTDSQGKWEVTYRLPANRIGGAPVVLIDKQTGDVLRSYRTQ
ncbi:NTF2 fold immunity protein [Pinirhizobacter soli]|uniref:NTF2 fold immunity protein n=1 Tax=Pinirhizobacter soli TaxID=2786953 RepID=UPI003CCCD776